MAEWVVPVHESVEHLGLGFAVQLVPLSVLLNPETQVATAHSDPYVAALVTVHTVQLVPLSVLWNPESQVATAQSDPYVAALVTVHTVHCLSVSTTPDSPVEHPLTQLSPAESTMKLVSQSVHLTLVV